MCRVLVEFGFGLTLAAIGSDVTPIGGPIGWIWW